MTTLEIILLPFALLGMLMIAFAVCMIILDYFELRDEREAERRAPREGQ